MSSTKHICLWSGPRNISTALMYAFAQREDTQVFDEPLYAYYLKNHSSAKEYHPGSEQILASMEGDGDKVVKEMLSFSEKPVGFFKQMTHHLLDLDKSFMHNTINILLTRNPSEMIPSYLKVIDNPTIDDIGYKLHMDLVNYFLKNNIAFVVLNSKDVLLDPKSTLTKLCKFSGIPFDEGMLSWKPQKRPEDGVWAKYWYINVHKSTGFKPYVAQEKVIPPKFQHLLATSNKYYKSLMEYAI